MSANRFRTKCGDVVMVEIYHDYVAKNVNGVWLGWDSKPSYSSWGWERTGDSPDRLQVVESVNPDLDWKNSLESVDYYQESKERQAAKPKFCRCCTKPAVDKFMDTPVYYCGDICKAKLQKFWDSKVKQLVEWEFDKLTSKERYWY